MKLSCKIAEDLLPLYLDDSCSEDSRAALEEHLKECPSCQSKLTRMRSSITDSIQIDKSVPQLANYAKKVRNHRIRVTALVILTIIISSAVLTLCSLTIRDMYHEASPTVIEVEEGTYNLTANDLETTAEEIEQYVFYTNYTQIKVTVGGIDGFHGTVNLWDATDSRGVIQTYDVNEKTNTCTFSCGSAAIRYKITCDNLDGATITVSEGRTISFWRSLKSVLNEIIRR